MWGEMWLKSEEVQSNESFMMWWRRFVRFRSSERLKYVFYEILCLWSCWFKYRFYHQSLFRPRSQAGGSVSLVHPRVRLILWFWARNKVRSSYLECESAMIVFQVLIMPSPESTTALPRYPCEWPWPWPDSDPESFRSSTHLTVMSSGRCWLLANGAEIPTSEISSRFILWSLH